MKNRFTYKELETMKILIEVGINDKYTEIMNMRESDGYAAEYLLKEMDKLIDLGNKVNELINRKSKKKYHVIRHYRIINGTTTYGEVGMYLQKLLRYHMLPKKIDVLLPF